MYHLNQMREKRLIFTDVDGSKYYLDRNNDIVNHHGELVTLTQEANIRSFLNSASNYPGTEQDFAKDTLRH